MEMGTRCEWCGLTFNESTNEATGLIHNYEPGWSLCPKWKPLQIRESKKMKAEIDVQVLSDISDFFHDLEVAGLTLPPKIDNVDSLTGPYNGAWHKVSQAIMEFNMREKLEKEIRTETLKGPQIKA
jgi:hypothetical protein